MLASVWIHKSAQFLFRSKERPAKIMIHIMLTLTPTKSETDPNTPSPSAVKQT